MIHAGHRGLALAAIASALLLAGCGTSPTSPVVTPPLSSLTLTPALDTLAVGDAHTFTVVARDTSGHIVSVGVTWQSGDLGILRVSGGRVTGIGEGTTTLIAAAGGARDTAWVTVLPVTAGWYVQPNPATANLNGVCFRPDGRVGWAVGDGGQIIETADAGATWTRRPSGTIFALNDVWFVDDHEGWAVGAGGTVLHSTDAGGNWDRIASLTTESLLAVTFTGRDTGWIVGSNGTVLRTLSHGAGWSQVHPTALTLDGVAFAGRDGWAVGATGLILGSHDAGASWFIVQPAVTTQNLEAVVRLSDAIAFAAGASGVVPRTARDPDSVAWGLGSAGAASQLSGISFASRLVGFVVGFNGAGIVLRTGNGGTTWTPQAPGTPNRLNDVWFVDGNRGWAVGNSGTIIHTATGGTP